MADHALGAPNTSCVQVHKLVIVSLDGVGALVHIINSTGGPDNTHGMRTNVFTLSRGGEHSFFAQYIRYTGAKWRKSTYVKAG